MRLERTVALVGMPGAGKSTIGRLLAQRLNLPFSDTDTVVEAEAGRPVVTIFAEEGEAGFRAREREAIAGLLEGPHCVLGVGGGAFADPATRLLLRQGARTVWLRASLSTLAARVGDARRRPLLRGPDPKARLRELIDKREPAFAQADLCVQAEGPARVVVERVVDALARGPEVETIPVEAARFDYEVVVGRGLIDSAGERVRAVCGGGRALIVADRSTDALFGERLERTLAAAGFAVARYAVAPGEAAKSWEGLAGLCDACAAAGLTRGDVIVALGGGVVGDLAGLAAALYMRGVMWVGVPTTLLAQVDSSVGGKTAIDIPAGKNLVGAFWPPRLVLADLDALETLPDREMRAGFAEVLKYGLLGDSALFGWLEHHGSAVLAREGGALMDAVAACVRAKARIVSADEREGGRRALLNLGHTFGHALEAEAGFSAALLHGEAVALGCALAFRFAAALGMCPKGDAERVERVICAAGLPTRLADLGAPMGADALIARMAHDKKAGAHGLTLVLPQAIGRAVVWPVRDADELRRFLVLEGAQD